MTDRPTDTARRQRPRYAERRAGKYETASAHRGTVTSLLTELTVLQNCIAEHLITLCKVVQQQIGVGGDSFNSSFLHISLLNLTVKIMKTVNE